ncbi:MAG: tetratricopeptide repeat protein [Gemmataceae bacterium]
MSRTRLIIRIVLIVLLLGTATFVGWYYFFAGGPASYVRAGESAYLAGLKAMEQEKNPESALLRFDETKLQAQRAIQSLEKVVQNQTSLSEEDKVQKTVLLGKANWLRALSLRDGAYAAALAEERPLMLSIDASTGQQFRSIHAIPDKKTREQAIVCLRRSGLILTSSKNVQWTALRSELLLRKLNWQFVRTFSENLLELEPENPYALFMLAKYDFEQPVTNTKNPTGISTPPNQRQKARVEKALQRATKALTVEGVLPWRTRHLKGMIHEWLAKYAEKRGNEDEADAQWNQLETMLEGPNGALAQAARGEDLETVGVWDRDGALNLHVMAVDLTARQVVKKRADTGTLKKVVADVVSFAQGAPKFNKSFTPALVSEMAVTALKKAQPFLSMTHREWWEEQMESVKESAKQAAKVKQGSLKLYGRLAQLTHLEYQIASRAAKKDQQQRLRSETLTWLDHGMTIAKALPQTRLDLFQFHAQAATLKVALGTKQKAVQDHFRFIEKAKTPAAKAVRELLEGANFQQAGKLRKARERLETVLASKQEALIFLAHANLVSVYQGLGRPTDALTSLRNIEAFYANLSQRSAQERAWVEALLGNEAQVQSLIVRTRLEVAYSGLTKRQKRQPNRTISATEFEDLAGRHERAAKTILSKFSAPSPEHRQGHSDMAQYYLRLNRLEEARQEIQSLRKAYPASVRALQLHTALLVQENQKTNPRSFDKTIQTFLETNPDSVGGRYFWVMWLHNTDRDEEALAYLQAPGNFPKAKSDEHRALLALLLHQAGRTNASQKAAEAMGPSPQFYDLMIQFGANLDEKQKQLSEALERYQHVGRFICRNAALQWNEGKFEEAAREFAKALEITRVEKLAQRGVQLSLAALAQRDPRKAKGLATDLLTTYPQEPSLYIGYANACLLLNNLGTPRDSWEQTKTMAAAVNAWAQRANSRGTIPGELYVVKAAFWYRANRLDLVRPELNRALAQNPRHPRALELAVSLALEMSDPNLLKKAAGRLATLEAVEPNSAGATFLRGRIAEHQKEPDQALQAYKQALEKNEKYALAYRRLIRLLDKQGKSQEGVKWVREWRKNLPNSNDAMTAEVTLLAKSGKTTEADKLVETYLEKQRKRLEKIQTLAKRPEGMTAEEFSKSNRRADQLLEKRIRLQGAVGFLRAHKHNEAQKRVTELLRDDSEWAPALLVMANICLQRKDMGDYAGARSALEKVVKQQPGNSVAANNLAYILATQFNEPTQALKIMNTIRRGRFNKELLPGDRLPAAVLDTLGVIYTQLDDASHANEMRDLFKAALRRHPYDPRMYLYLGRACARLSENATAEGYFREASRLAKSTLALSEEKRQQVIEQLAKARS